MGGSARRRSKGWLAMELGLIGLGKMGGNMAERLRRAGHKVIGFDFNKDAVKRLSDAGGIGVHTVYTVLSRHARQRLTSSPIGAWKARPNRSGMCSISRWTCRAGGRRSI